MHIKTILYLVVMLLGCCAVHDVCGQEITLLFPAEGDSIRFQDLLDRGFEWQAPPTENTLQIRIFSANFVFLSQQPLVVESSPFKLDSTFELYFHPGDVIVWQMEEVDADGVIVKTTDQVTFSITDDTNLIPTPTPLVRPTPSGNLDFIASIDARDLLLFASSWMQADGSFLAGDLNQDLLINQYDLLLLLDRFGETAPVPTPAPAVGIPRDVTLVPDRVLTFNDTFNFQIQWSPPAYPAGASFFYDVLVLTPFLTKIEKNGLTATSYQPFQFNSQTGTYDVFIRARVEGVGSSDIVSSSFEIVISKPVAPTPTPVPQTSDMTGDGKSDIQDAGVFLQSFGRNVRQVGFHSSADLHTDEQVDKYDLLLFRQFFSQRNLQIDAPLWTQADIPIVESIQLEPPDAFQRVDLVPPYVIELGQTDAQNPLAELRFLRIHFTPVAGAVDYFVSYYQEETPETVFTFTTDGQPFFDNYVNENQAKIVIFNQQTTIVLHIQAIHKDQQLGMKSTALRIVIP